MLPAWARRPYGSSSASKERRNLAQLARWEKTYNDEVDAMVDEVYAERCEVTSMTSGRTFHGREELRALEHQIAAAASGRRLEVLRAIASDDVVVAECVGRFGATSINACVVLTFDDEGRIISDHTYSPDPTGLSSNPAS